MTERSPAFDRRDCGECGWDSIDTLLDILEEQGTFPVLRKLRAGRDAKKKADQGRPKPNSVGKVWFSREKANQSAKSQDEG